MFNNDKTANSNEVADETLLLTTYTTEIPSAYEFESFEPLPTIEDYQTVKE